MLAFDHAILAVADLAAAGRRLLADRGLASLPGGRHRGLGTANRIVPLGPDYLELMAVAGAPAAGEGWLGEWVREQSRQGDRPAALCLRTDDLDAVARRLGLEPVAMSRERPDGTVLSWRLAGVREALAEPPLPFFISWEVPPELHPGRAAAPHRLRPRGIARVELSGDPGRLGAWLGPHDLPLEITPGPPALRAVVLATDRGEIRLPG